jgi:hypothetical protein
MPDSDDEPEIESIDSAGETDPVGTAEQPAPAAAPSAGERRARAAAVTRPYPRRGIEDALRVPNTIRDTNGGNPWAPDQIAASLGMGTGSTFFYLTAASRDYGFTEGTRDAAEIRIADRGRKAVYPTSDDERRNALLDAFFGIAIFNKVVEHFGGSKLPAEPFRTNTLTSQFELDPSLVDEFVDVFNKNCRFLGIGNTFVRGQSAAPSAPVPAIAAAVPVVQATPNPDVVIVSTAKSKPGQADARPVCFIAMPFTERHDDHSIGFFDEVLKSIFTPAIEAAGFQVRTARRQGSDVIQRTIVRELLAADMVLVDLTEHNPNVLFELGMRITANKPIALVRATGTGGIFDVDTMLRVEDYNPNIWPSTILGDIESLTAHLKAAWDDRDSAESFFSILTRS